MPDDLGASGQGHLGQEVGEAVVGDVVAVLVRLQLRRLEAGDDAVEGRQRRPRLGERLAVAVVVAAAADGADPVDVGPAAAVGVVGDLQALIGLVVGKVHGVHL